MHWTDAASDAPFTIEHLQGALVIRVRRDLDDAGLRAVLDTLQADEASDAVLDLRGHEVEQVDALLPVLRDRPSLAVVSARGSLREALTAGGATRVHESLDAALADDAPAITRQQDRGPAALAPSAGDVTTVSAEDLLGQEPRA